MKFAAIDIGTNALRLLLSRVVVDGGPPVFRKESLIRMPLRLGEDAFTLGKISDEKIEMLTETINGFKHLIRAYRALDYMAMATSAMRVAANGSEAAKVVKERAGVEIDIIDGQREAQVICANQIEERLDPRTNYLYVDVGGGSTEVTIIGDRAVVASESFRIGTVRILQGGITQNQWDDLKEWLKQNATAHRPLTGIGSGGNINKIFKLAHIKEGRMISYRRIKKLYNYLKSFSLEERITHLKLRPDRADVIMPASEIYMSIMKWAKTKRMYVPQFGLPDGMIHLLYEKHRGGN
jgi:exopolyphosphatase/guanosine-5'-triphosphate,3'-diphosphate pyrophosphatase